MGFVNSTNSGSMGAFSQVRKANNDVLDGSVAVEPSARPMVVSGVRIEVAPAEVVTYFIAESGLTNPSPAGGFVKTVTGADAPANTTIDEPLGGGDSIYFTQFGANCLLRWVLFGRA